MCVCVCVYINLVSGRLCRINICSKKTMSFQCVYVCMCVHVCVCLRGTQPESSCVHACVCLKNRAWKIVTKCICTHNIECDIHSHGIFTLFLS
jgi:hypothetical protein